MQKKSIILFLAVGIAMSAYWAVHALAEGEELRGGGAKAFSFNFRYLNGSLLPDAVIPYEIISRPPSMETTLGSKVYKGELRNFANDSLSIFFFDPEEETRIASDFSVRTVYFGDAATADFYDDRNKKIFTISVADTSLCNDNASCNAEFGENWENCPADCPVPIQSPSVIPPSMSAASEQSFWHLGTILAVIAIIVCLVAFLFIRTRHV